MPYAPGHEVYYPPPAHPRKPNSLHFMRYHQASTMKFKTCSHATDQRSSPFSSALPSAALVLAGYEAAKGQWHFQAAGIGADAGTRRRHSNIGLCNFSAKIRGRDSQGECQAWDSGLDALQYAN